MVAQSSRASRETWLEKMALGHWVRRRGESVAWGEGEKAPGPLQRRTLEDSALQREGLPPRGED